MATIDPEIVIEEVSAPTDEIRALIGELDRELEAHYQEAQRHGLAVDAIFQPGLRFFVARRDGVAIGCGGVASFAGFAEVKRMYVRPSARGGGVARAILSRLEEAVRAAGHVDLRLETGMHQHAAIRLYRRAGFAPCDAFGPYATMDASATATSAFFAKPLPPPP